MRFDVVSMPVVGEAGCFFTTITNGSVCSNCTVPRESKLPGDGTSNRIAIQTLFLKYDEIFLNVCLVAIHTSN